MSKKEKNTGLGRGLDSLIPKIEETEVEEGISLEDLLRESEDESKTFEELVEEVEKLLTLYSLDIVNMDTCKNQLLLEDISMGYLPFIAE